MRDGAVGRSHRLAGLWPGFNRAEIAWLYPGDRSGSEPGLSEAIGHVVQRIEHQPFEERLQIRALPRPPSPQRQGVGAQAIGRAPPVIAPRSADLEAGAPRSPRRGSADEGSMSNRFADC
jgi:hypothetical protein